MVAETSREFWDIPNSKSHSVLIGKKFSNRCPFSKAKGKWSLRSLATFISFITWRLYFWTYLPIYKYPKKGIFKITYGHQILLKEVALKTKVSRPERTSCPCNYCLKNKGWLLPKKRCDWGEREFPKFFHVFPSVQTPGYQLKLFVFKFNLNTTTNERH